MSTPAAEVNVAAHDDAVDAHHRFGVVTFHGAVWDLSHLAPFAFRANIGRDGSELWVDVVVLFSCHCFTHGDDGSWVPASEYFDDGREVRVLCDERYYLSREYLPRIIKELFARQIRVASAMPNYVTCEVLDEGGHPSLYAVFFEVEKDRKRKKRLILRVQSAYRIGFLTQRQQKAGKVNLGVLLRATYEGRKIKG